MPDVCNVSETLGISYYSSQEASVVLNGREIACTKRFNMLYSGVQHIYVGIRLGM